MAPKVLIAHGNTQRLKQAVADLQARGFDVAATPDGGDAFARFFEEGPDAVICSEALPGLSGVNFARMVRSQSPRTPVVLVTETAQGADAAGFEVVTEPFDVDAFCAAHPDLAPPAPPQAPVEPARPVSTTEVFMLSALKRYQRGSHPLALLDDAGIARMARIAEQRLCGEGEQIIRQGDAGDSFYIVIEGHVRVTLKEQEGGEVARIGAGGVFGEMALLSDQPRSASVWSLGTTTLLRFRRTDFLPLLDDYPSLREVLSGVAIERSEENLWSVLLADDEVQMSLAGLQASRPAGSPAAAVAGERAAVPEDESRGRPHRQAAPRASSGDAAAHGTSARPSPASRDVADTAPRGVAAAGRPGAAPGSGPQVRRRHVWLGGGVGFAAGALAMALGALALTSRGDERQRPGADSPDPAAPATGMPPSASAAPEAAADGAQSAPPAIAGEKAPAPAPAPARTLSSIERKELRRELLARLRSGDHAGALAAGEALRASAKIDWEAEFAIAEAERGAGRLGAALESYRAFVARYPSNLRADDALFWSAEILLGQGKTAEAQAFYEQVLANPKTRYRESAQARLRGP